MGPPVKEASSLWNLERQEKFLSWSLQRACSPADIFISGLPASKTAR